MPRNMSFAFTTKQYLNQTKNVTRRLGWAFARVGNIQNGCEKCQGLRKGERIVKLGQHRLIDLRWELLCKMTEDIEYGQAECIKEGFPGLTPAEFVEMFCDHNKCFPWDKIHRMEFEYLDPVSAIKIDQIFSNVCCKNFAWEIFDRDHLGNWWGFCFNPNCPVEKGDPSMRGVSFMDEDDIKFRINQRTDF